MSNRYCWIEIAQEDAYIFPESRQGDFIMTLTTDCNMHFGMSNNHPVMTLGNNDSSLSVNGYVKPQRMQFTNDGTKMYPTLAWINDISTGLYHPSSNHISLVTNQEDRLLINSAGNIGLGTADPSERLDVRGNTVVTGYVQANALKTDGQTRIDAQGNLSNIRNLYFASQILPVASNTSSSPSYAWSNDPVTGMYLHDLHQIGLSANSQPIMFIGSNVGLGTAYPQTLFHIRGGPASFEQNGSILLVEGNTNGSYVRTASNLGNIKTHIGGVGGVIMQSHSNNAWADRFVIGQNGNVQVLGTTASGTNTSLGLDAQDNGYRIRTIELNKSLVLNGSSNIVMFPDPLNIFKLTLTNQGLRFSDTGSPSRPSIGWDTYNGCGMYSANGSVCISAANALVASFEGTGINVHGNINATGSKNFYIDHPLLEDHKLVHAAVESPRFDLIYRGKASLVDGCAIVDVDATCNDAGGMSEGTFVSLTRNHQVFCQNNTIDSWDQVKGYVENGKLKIYSNNPASTATVDWLIMAERDDQAIKMMNAASDGRLVVEVPSSILRI